MQHASNESRVVRDSDETEFEVFEYAPEGEQRSLVFESAGSVRRLRNFPADWFTLSAAALLALSQ